jgi:hypothetical protein
MAANACHDVYSRQLGAAVTQRRYATSGRQNYNSADIATSLKYVSLRFSILISAYLPASITDTFLFGSSLKYATVASFQIPFL